MHLQAVRTGHSKKHSNVHTKVFSRSDLGCNLSGNPDV